MSKLVYFIGLVAIGLILTVGARAVSAQGVDNFGGGYVVNECPNDCPPAIYGTGTPVISSRAFLGARSPFWTRPRTAPMGAYPYTTYGPIFGYVRPNSATANPYAGINPEAGNPYAGYTITRGPRDFLMKNPPNIGP